jgi:hypothetical protein
MSIADPIAEFDKRFPPIFGAPHSLLVKVASQAACDAAAVHIRAGRLTKAPHATAVADDMAPALGVRVDDFLP